jgi:hypothetical protein
MKRSSFRRIARATTGATIACGALAAYFTPEEAYVFLGASVLLAVGVWYSYKAKDGDISSAKGYDPEPADDSDRK